MKKLTLTLAITLIFSAFLIGQNKNSGQFIKNDTSSTPYWIKMMQDPDENFFKTVRAFNLYWDGREITKGSGFKPFKRWENHWRDRVNPDGSRKSATETFNSFSNYLSNSYRDNHFEGNWINLGPIEQPGNSGTGQPNGNGRINDIAFHPSDSETIFIGAPAGGLWKTSDGGMQWQNYTDDLPTLGVSSIIIDYTNPDVIYIGTGDRDAGDAEGMGVMKSIDGGDSWEFYSSGMGNVTVGRMIIHPSINETLLAATSSGIYKTLDAALNWTLVKSGNFKEIVFKTDNPEIVYASASGGFYRSTDGGINWTRITDGIGAGDRGVIGVTQANPEIVYFLKVSGSEYAGIYKSINTGLNFNLMSDSPNIMSWGCTGGTGGQGWYDLDIAVDPTNENIVYAGGVNVFKSTNSGVNWDINSHWYGGCGVPAVHADCHSLEYSPLDGKLYAGNDGGIYWTENGGTSWNEITSGLAISQIYKIGQAKTSKDKVMNGYQDNGSATYLGEQTGFLTVMGGDGMDCVYDHQDDRYAYGEYYYGAVSRIFNNNNQGSITNGISEEGAWVTPIALDVEDAETMYVGMKNLWVSHNVRANNVSWSKLTENLGGSNSKDIRVIEQSEINPDILYIARWDNKLFRTENLKSDNPEWINISGSLPISGTPTDIETNSFSEDIVYMTLNYKVFKSENRGQSWEDITLNLPIASTNTIEFYKSSNSGVYVGTDAGIYYKDNTLDEWILFSDGFPVAANVTEIEIYYDPDSPSGDLIRASTYGRGLWSSLAFYDDLNANFQANEISIPLGCNIDFQDLSTGVPHSWNWTFEGGTPSSSTLQNPSGIQYLEEGIFEVSLTVSNPTGSNTKTITGYINVNSAMLPQVDFISPDTIQCQATSAHFFDQSQGCPIAWEWSFSPNSITYLEGTNENSPNPIVALNENAIYSVSLEVTNSAGSNSITKDNYIKIGGASIPFLEDFENATLQSSGWTIDNPDADLSWELFEVEGNEPGSFAAGINLSEYYAVGERDRLISPPLNLKGLSHAFLSFQYAYAQRYAGVTDSLIVYISDDCGITWTPLIHLGEDGSGNFATHELTDEFWPTIENDWCGSGWGSECYEIDLSEWTGKDKVQIAFESYSFYGNPILIDNVRISNFVGFPDDIANENSFDILPNPSKGSFELVIDYNQPSIFYLVDLKGHVLLSETINNRISNIDVSFINSGIYLVKIQSGDTIRMKKLVIQH